jgi:DnaJ-class molecular chaperone
MIYTEKEAGTKFCCDGGMVHSSQRNRYFCVASACMAWRLAFDAGGQYAMKQVSPPTDCAACSGSGTMYNEEGELGGCPECEGNGKIGHYERMGYCGLAGTPQ